MSDQPEVVVDPRTVLCDRHAEPLKASWPNGYPTVALVIVYQATQLEEIVNAAGANPSNLTAVLIEYGPLCELLDDALVAEVVRTALYGDRDEWRAMMRKYGPPPPGGWRD